MIEYDEIAGEEGILANFGIMRSGLIAYFEIFIGIIIYASRTEETQIVLLALK